MKKYQSEISQAVHQTISDLYEAGFVDKQTMREFDKACLTPIAPLSPEEIRQVREKAQISQTVFAHYLNVSKNLLSDWERGVKKPSGAALKLLTLVKNKGIEIIA
ncbi:helix-turn-helix domain-containing protein [[Haemophilus] felis]|uniref:Transcriptional regulator n=1 Tax=[Haemophilus] felis TaxID=123822 RepID=A0A1T0AZT0_9PAST|nr:helix-turn-helix domain-containing protein [[Haemophilus] felis]NBI40630.1 helix-turn-helix domain-containing protein [[Haemophilus] felis]NBI42146.1 helix-turn-helix domain-containing protein [[Haemophilus] felis]OOS02991.1 transcriptional regulator [[Haemophilus] felis]